MLLVVENAVMLPIDVLLLFHYRFHGNASDLPNQTGKVQTECLPGRSSVVKPFCRESNNVDAPSAYTKCSKLSWYFDLSDFSACQ